MDESRLQHLVERFFGKGNDVSLPDVMERPNPSARCARVWLERFPQTGQLVLPRASQGRLFWYALGATPAAARALREPLMAFAGPTLSTFRGVAHPTRADDPIEAAISEFSGPSAPVFRFESGSRAGARRRLATALLRMATLADQAETRDRFTIQDTSSILRQFGLSLAAGDTAGARELLDTLRRLRRLDAANLEFLDVRLHAEMGDWEGLLSRPSIDDIVNARRTTAVTRALLTAVYNVELYPYEQAHDPHGARSHFREHVGPRYGPIFESRRGMTDATAVKCLMVAAISETPPRVLTIGELASLEAVCEDDSAWLHALADLASSPPDAPAAPFPRSRALQAREHLIRRDYDRVLQLLSDSPPDLGVASCLLECAYELRTTESELAAMAAYHALQPAERSELLSSRRYRHFLEEFGGAQPSDEGPVIPPAGWVEWLDRCAGPIGDEQKMLAWASRGAEEWEVLTVAEDASQVQALTTAMHRACDRPDGRNVLRAALPDLLTAFQDDPEYPRPVFRCVYWHLAELLSYGMDAPAPRRELGAFGMLCQAVLELGTDASEYRDLLDMLTILWDGGSARTLPPALDALDLFVAYPCVPTAEAKRAELAVLLLQATIGLRRGGRVDDVTWCLAQQIAADLGLQSMVDGIDEDRQDDGERSYELADRLGRLSGTVGIYTLTERVGVRVREVLSRLAPTCTIEINSDRVATPRLRALARRADCFVMVVRSAKHAATDSITRERGNRPLLRPNGKGLSSVLRALGEYAGAV